jgi:hypothetical protein
LIIYTESDYLEAHLTEISAAEVRNWPLSIDTVPKRLNSVLKKFTATTSDTPSSTKSRPGKNRRNSA